MASSRLLNCPDLPLPSVAALPPVQRSLLTCCGSQSEYITQCMTVIWYVKKALVIFTTNYIIISTSTYAVFYYCGTTYMYLTPPSNVSDTLLASQVSDTAFSCKHNKCTKSITHTQCHLHRQGSDGENTHVLFDSSKVSPGPVHNYLLTKYLLLVQRCFGLLSFLKMKRKENYF